MSNSISSLKYNIVRLLNQLGIKSFQPKKPNFKQQDTAIPIDLNKFIDLVEYYYANRSGYICAFDREDPTLAQKNIFLTYGEILPQGLARLFEFVNPTMNDSFVDLGSGAGKTVLQSYLCTDMHASYGVEIDLARHNLAHDVLEKIKQETPVLFEQNNKSIEFINSSIEDFDFSQVTLVFANSTCFGGNLITDILKKINNSPNIRAVFTTKKIEGFKYLPEFEIVPIETSWHVPPSKSNCYVYYK